MTTTEEEARRQLGQILYLTKAPSTQALVDGYLARKELAGLLREWLIHDDLTRTELESRTRHALKGIK